MDLIYTIRDVVMESVGQDAEASKKPIVYFNEVEKGMVINKTNAATISNLYGPETDSWIGKKIAIFATEVDFKGTQTLALRVRIKAPGGTAKQLPRGKPAQEAPAPESEAEAENIPFEDTLDEPGAVEPGYGEAVGLIKNIKTVPNKSGKGSRHHITLDDGINYATFDEKIKTAAVKLGIAKARVRIVFEVTKFGNDIFSVKADA